MANALTVVLSIVLFVGTAVLWEGVAHFTHRHRVQKNGAYAPFFAFSSFLLIYLGLLHHVPPVWSAGFGVALYGVGYVGFHDIMFHRRITGLVLKPRSPCLRRIITARRVHHRTNTKEGATSFGFLWAPRSYAGPQQGGEA